MNKKQRTLFSWGRPFSPIYSLAMRLREKLYAFRLLTRTTLPVPVISVGNLVLGGTGKTPMVRYLVDFLRQEGYHPAIVSRGYRGTAKNAVNVVSDGKSILLSAEEAGDEPSMLANTLRDIPVLTGKKRILPAREAVALGADCLILDDGFQHLAVKRDLDIVLFDAVYQAGNSRVFPGGPLREPVAALNRADCFIITGTTDTNKERAEKFAVLLQQRFPGRPVFFSHRSRLCFSDLQGTICDPAKLGPAFAFCGIALPERFAESLKETAVDLCGFISLADHTNYTALQMEKMEQKAQQQGAKVLITTEKDAVKLRQFPLSMPLYIARVETKVEEDFTLFVENRLKNSRNSV